MVIIGVFLRLILFIHWYTSLFWSLVRKKRNLTLLVIFVASICYWIFIYSDYWSKMSVSGSRSIVINDRTSKIIIQKIIEKSTTWIFKRFVIVFALVFFLPRIHIMLSEVEQKLLSYEACFVMHSIYLAILTKLAIRNFSFESVFFFK